MKKEKTVENIKAYFEGTVRVWVYFNCKWALQKHIVEQFEWRSQQAVRCLVNGSCLGCGCKTPDVFMSTKGCPLEEYPVKVRKGMTGSEAVCYPKMMNKKDWNEFITVKNRIDELG